VTTTHALTTPTISLDSTRHTNPAHERKTLRVPARVTAYIAGTDCGEQVLRGNGDAVPGYDRIRVAAYRMLFDTTPRADGSRHVAWPTREHLDMFREITETLKEVSVHNVGTCKETLADLNAARATLKRIDALDTELRAYRGWITSARTTRGGAAVRVASHYRPSDCAVGPHGERAQSWQGATALDTETGDSYDINTDDVYTHTALFRTSNGEWWVQTQSTWTDVEDHWARINEDDARAWLLTNSHADAAAHDFATAPGPQAR
jgi:hypothetical protein